MQGNVDIAIQLFHSSLSSNEIKKHFTAKPDVEFSVGAPWVLPNGKILSGFHKESYICYEISGIWECGELEEAVEYTNTFFRKIIDDTSFLDIFVKTGGRINYYIGLYINRHDAFNLSPELLKQCEELHVNLGTEIFLDNTEEESSRKITI